MFWRKKSKEELLFNKIAKLMQAAPIEEFEFKEYNYNFVWMRPDQGFEVHTERDYDSCKVLVDNVWFHSVTNKNLTKAVQEVIDEKIFLVNRSHRRLEEEAIDKVSRLLGIKT